MRVKTTLTAVTLVLAIGASQIAGQESSNTARSKSNTLRKYDRFEDRTMVWTPFQNLDTNTTNDLIVSAYFTYHGKGAGKPIETLAFVFESTSRQRVYLKDNELNVIVDGERVPLGRPTWRDSEVLSEGRGVHEKFIFKTPYSVLKKIANAKKVEMRLGQSEFDLKSTFLETLQDLLGKVAPAVANPRRRKT